MTGEEDIFRLAHERNINWVNKVAQTERDPNHDPNFGPPYGPTFFADLAKNQTPKILWIGCSDSRVPETTLLDLKPGDVFVHRNIANVLHPGDISSQSVIQYAVGVVGVKHVVLCGHTGCGGCQAALGNKTNGLIDAWLHPLRALRARHARYFQEESGQDKPEDVQKNILANLNVAEGVALLRQNPYIVDAMKHRNLQVHGVMYNLDTGRLDVLDTPDGPDDETLRDKVFDLGIRMHPGKH